MARITINVEAEGITEAVEDLLAIHKALRTRHGEAFRALDRRIEAVIDDCDGCAAVHALIGGDLMVAPAGELAAILRDGRRLGLL